MPRNQIVVPDGLRELLQEFTVSVLREKPRNLIDFAANYFAMKKAGEPNVEQSDDEESVIMPPPTRNLRRTGVAAESFDPEKEVEMPKVFHPKTSEQRARLMQATKGILLFKSLDDDQMSDVIDAMFERRVEIGEKVITLGEDGDNFYVIESGIYDIIVKVNGELTKVGQYDNKGSFGELALMYNTPRAATIVATEPGVLWAMTREVFRGIVLKKAFQKRQMYEELLDKVPLLKSLSSYERMNIADALVTKTFESDTQVIAQGEPGEEMFFIEEGEVIIKMTADGVEKEVTKLQKGQYFGELALLTKQPRAASAYTSSRCKLAVLDVESFERLLGPCLDILHRNIDEYRDQLKNIFGNNIPELRK